MISRTLAHSSSLVLQALAVYLLSALALISFTYADDPLAALKAGAVQNISKAPTADVGVAKQWLTDLDDKKYADTWRQSDAYFKTLITIEDWEKAVSEARKAAGKMLTRKLVTASSHGELPGTPDGEYRVHAYDSRFENNAQAKEIVTLSKASGQWKVIAYYIQ